MTIEFYPQLVIQVSSEVYDIILAAEYAVLNKKEDKLVKKSLIRTKCRVIRRFRMYSYFEAADEVNIFVCNDVSFVCSK